MVGPHDPPPGPVTDRFAAEGFVALAPDLYGGRTTHDAAEANELATSLPRDRAVRDLSGAVDHLLGHDAVTSSTVGAVGFCMGGGFVLSLAAAVGREGLRGRAVLRDCRRRARPVDDDRRGAGPLRPAGPQHPGGRGRAESDRIERETGRAPRIHLYDAGHAFVNDENLKGTFDPETAALAWSRAVEFLREQVR